MSSELKQGRTFGFTMQDGREFFEQLQEFCKENNVKQAYIPIIQGGLSSATITKHVKDCKFGDAPQFMELKDVEVLTGSGTITFDEESGKISPHIHVSLAKMFQNQEGLGGCLKKGVVKYLIELLVIEIASPKMKRISKPEINANVLSFEV